MTEDSTSAAPPGDLATNVHALRTIRASALHTLGRTGRGVGIAVLDTGVTEVAGLDGRVAGGVNLTGIGPMSVGDEDWFGHGTFVAGLAAGDRGKSPPSDQFQGGVAPRAHVVPIKVAAPDGATDIANVIAGIQWAVAHADRYLIRVINLSFGTNSQLDWREDPLNYVVERAWDAGIVVVVAAGNDSGDDSVTTPGQNPLVLTVGSAASDGTVGAGDDHVDEASGHGRAGVTAKPDVLAPGELLVSYRVPGSFVDVHQPQSVRDEHYQRATGTSFAAAMVSGAVALLLERHPDWTPAQVKGALMATATPVGGSVERQGAGVIDVAAADALADPPLANRVARRHPLALHGGLGDLELARGDLRLSPMGADGHLDAGTRATACSGVELRRRSLRRDGWTEQSWAQTWQGADWQAVTWPSDDDDPDHRPWTDKEFNGHHWVGHHWVGHHWVGHHWWGHHWWGHHWA